MSDDRINYLKNKLVQYPDFPKKGILFEDVSFYRRRKCARLDKNGYINLLN